MTATVERVVVSGLAISNTATPQTPIVSGVTFTVSDGEVLGIVGESGSGKSLTLRAIAGLLAEGLQVSAGTITSDGAQIGMVFQEPMTALNPTKRVWDIITVAPRRRHGWSRARARKEAERLLLEVGIPDAKVKASLWPHQLSGGLRQRVMIAMALANSPDVLLCDEPTTAVDVIVQQQILDLIKRIQRERDLAVIFVSHDLSVIRHLCDRVLVMRHGRVLESGGIDEVFDHPQDPYTKALVGSVPTMQTDKTQPLITVAGALTEARPAEQLRSPHDRVPAQDVPEKASGVFVSDLVASYRARRPWRAHDPSDDVVKGVSFEIPHGTTLGLVGASGCGKSTVARVMAGLHPLISGSITIDGITLEYPRPRSAARLVQMVFQDPSAALNPSQTVGESIMELLAAHRLGATRQLRLARAHELLDMVELPRGTLNSYARQMSGGQKQRVGIAKALALEPRLLIADESVASLDVSVQATVLNTLRTLQADLGLTLLFISHDLAVTRYISDRVAAMQSGVIVETGEADQLVQHPQHPYTRQLLEASVLD